MKKGIIKGFSDIARALCDEKHVAEELKNVEDVFVADSFEEEQEYRGMMVVPYIPDVSEQFRRIAAKHFFRTA